MTTPAIVVVAYNRPHSLNRILQSIAQAEYEQEGIPLIISIDHSDKDDVKNVAKSFIWTHGPKKVVTHEESLGLKQHVLQCGELTGEYGSIIMLEDDLFVAPSFYTYASAALEFVKDRQDIGGVSLYNHRLNVHVREPFEAMEDGYDNWYFQFASSWGQAFTVDQWRGFTEWMEKHDGELIAADNVPVNVSSWSDKSWLKYYIKYLIITGKYFLYPRISYTTNFSDMGTHKMGISTDLQVPLAGKNRHSFSFSTTEQSEAVYDAFFENKRLATQLGIQEDFAEIDLYGSKPGSRRYRLTSQLLPYEVIRSYGRLLRPMDANIIYGISGEDFFLYDTKKKGTPPKKRSEAYKLLYYYRAFKAKYMKEILKFRLKER